MVVMDGGGWRGDGEDVCAVAVVDCCWSIPMRKTRSGAAEESLAAWVGALFHLFPAESASHFHCASSSSHQRSTLACGSKHRAAVVLGGGGGDATFPRPTGRPLRRVCLFLVRLLSAASRDTRARPKPKCDAAVSRCDWP